MFLHNKLHLPIPLELGLVPKLKLIDNARTDGLDVFFDFVTTSQGFTTLAAFFPPYAVEGSLNETLERLKNREFRKKVLNDIENVEPEWPLNEGATWTFNYIKITGWGGLIFNNGTALLKQGAYRDNVLAGEILRANGA